MITVKDLRVSQPCHDEMINVVIDGETYVMEPAMFYEMCKSFFHNNKLETIDEFLDRKINKKI